MKTHLFHKKYLQYGIGMGLLGITSMLLFSGVFRWEQNAEEVFPITEEREEFAALNERFGVVEVRSLTENRIVGRAEPSRFLASVLQKDAEQADQEVIRTQLLLEDTNGSVFLLKSTQKRDEKMLQEYAALDMISLAELDQTGELSFDPEAIAVDMSGVLLEDAFSGAVPLRQKVRVAVIDSGIDIDHPAFRDALWVNTPEKNGTAGRDDDGNGFVDDFNGWDFVGDSYRVNDTVGHGTHVTGVIGAERTAFSSMYGVNADSTELIVLRVADASSGLKLSNVIAALEYAEKADADVVNMSFGFSQSSDIFQNVLKRLQERGVFLVAAAGNNNSPTPTYPAAYPEVVGVGSTNIDGSKWKTSNYGDWVDVTVPGQLLSTLPGGSYGTKSGTSQAAALATGFGAYIKAHFPNRTPQQMTTLLQRYATHFEDAFSVPEIILSVAEKEWIAGAALSLQQGRLPNEQEQESLALSRWMTEEEMYGFFLEIFPEKEGVLEAIAMTNRQQSPLTLAPNMLVNSTYLNALAAEMQLEQEKTLVAQDGSSESKVLIKQRDVMPVVRNIAQQLQFGDTVFLAAAAEENARYLSRYEFLVLVYQMLGSNLLN